MKDKYPEENLSIELRVNSRNNAQCRSRFLGNHKIAKDVPFVRIHGWGASGKTTLCICLTHCEGFFQQVDKCREEVRKVKEQILLGLCAKKSSRRRRRDKLDGLIVKRES